MSKLAERAMLSSLHIRSWSGMQVDREVTDSVNADFKAEKEAGRYNKRLVKSTFFSGVATAHSNARKVHRLYTLPWEDDGTRILSNTGYIEYTKKMRDCRILIEKEVKAFLEDLPQAITEGKTRLGDMFNVDDYPTVDELAIKFDFDVEVKPMPQAQDFRAKLSDEATKGIIKDIERRTNQRLENAMKDVFIRVEGLVRHMTEKLKAYVPSKDGNKAEGTIHSSLVYNIDELVNLIPVLNVTDDARITELTKQLRSDLVEHSPEILRADNKVRAETISKADKILKKVQSYMK